MGQISIPLFETSGIPMGIPCLTLEIGCPRSLNLSGQMHNFRWSSLCFYMKLQL